MIMNTRRKIIPWLLEAVENGDIAVKKSVTPRPIERVGEVFGLSKTPSPDELKNRFGVPEEKAKNLLKYLCGKDLHELGIYIIKAFDGKALSSDDVDIIAEMLKVKRLKKADILKISSTANLLYLHSPQDYQYSYSSLVYGEKNLSNVRLISELLNSISDDDISSMLSDITDDNANYVSELIYHESINRGVYQFRFKDVEVLKSLKVDMHHLGYFTSGSMSELIEHFLIMLSEDEISPKTVKDFMVGENMDFGTLVNVYPKLLKSEKVAACVAVELLQGKKFGESVLERSRYILANEESPVKSVSEYFNHYRSEIFFSVYYTWLLQSYAYGELSYEALCKTISGTKHLPNNDNEKAIFNGIISALKLFSEDEITNDAVSALVGTIGTPILISSFNFPSLTSNDIISFEQTSSDAWYDGYKTTNYSNVTVTPKEQRRGEVEGEIGARYEDVLNLCLEKGDYLTVIYQAPMLHKYSTGYYDLFAFERIVIKAASSVSKNVLESLPEGVKWSLCYFGIKHHCDWLPSCLNAINDFNRKPNYSTCINEDEGDIDFVAAIGEGDNIGACLNVDSSSLQDVFFTFQVRVIGRVKRDIDTVSAMFSLCMAEACQSGLISLSTELSDIRIPESAMYRYTSFNNSITGSHFPRLKAKSAHNQIKVLDQHLKEKGMFDSANSQMGSRLEGQFDLKDVRYIFGEFDWPRIFDHKMLSGKVTEIRFLFATYDGDNAGSVETISVKFTHMKPAELYCLYQFRTVNETYDAGYSSGQTHQLLLSIARFMPTIEHEGVLVNG